MRMRFLTAAAVLALSSPAWAQGDTALVNAGLVLRQAAYDAVRTTAKLDHKVLAALKSAPAGAEVLQDIHQVLAGEISDEIGDFGGIAPRLAAVQWNLEKSIPDIARSPKGCDAAPLPDWEAAIAARSRVRTAVESAARTKMRVDQIRLMHTRLTPIIADLRKKSRGSSEAKVLKDFQKEYQRSLHNMGTLIAKGLDNEELHTIAAKPGIDCAFPLPEESTTVDDPAQAPVLTELDARLGQALTWSNDQMPGGIGTGVNRNNGSSIAKNKHAWDSWCLAFVATAFGRDVENLKAGSAIASFNKFKKSGKIFLSRKDILPGSPVFFAARKANNYWGHIAIFTGRYDANGEPIIRTTGWKSWPGIHEISVADFEKKTGVPYTGWGAI